MGKSQKDNRHDMSDDEPALEGYERYVFMICTFASFLLRSMEALNSNHRASNATHAFQSEVFCFCFTECYLVSLIIVFFGALNVYYMSGRI